MVICAKVVNSHNYQRVMVLYTYIYKAVFIWYLKRLRTFHKRKRLICGFGGQKIKCKNVLTNNNESVIITPSKETRKRIKQSKKFIQFIAYINVPMKRMKIKERFG